MTRATSLRSRIAPFLVMDVMEAARQAETAGRQVLHLEVGQPGTQAPEPVRAAARAALESHALGYTVALGLPELRRRISKHYGRLGVDVDPERVVITSGASSAFVLTFLMAFDPGAKVALARPGYPCYRNILRALDLVPVEIDVDASTSYQLTPEHLSDPTIEGVILASPANPTGSVMTPQELSTIVDYCHDRDIQVVSDEIYHGLVYGGAVADTAARTSERALVIQSFSKYYSMTGWRLGWMLIPNDWRRECEALAQNLTICPPTLSQLAALAAFDCDDELQQHVQRYAENRSVVVEALSASGIHRRAPADGAFYVYADLSDFTRDASSFCQQLLAETDVAVTPGIDFDPVHGNQHVRLSYCGSTAAIREAMARIQEFLQTGRAGARG